jgi:hypothetical protein
MHLYDIITAENVGAGIPLRNKNKLSVKNSRETLVILISNQKTFPKNDFLKFVS